MHILKQIALFVVVAASIFALTGCSLSGAENTEPTDETKWVNYSNTYNGYKDYEIGIYERLRAKDLLEDNGLTDYSMNENKRHYNYTAEDFRSVAELDESYLYAMFVICDGETFNTVLEALGYEDLADFLVRMNYVDDEGEPSLFAWAIADNELISEIMVEKSRQ